MRSAGLSSCNTGNGGRDEHSTAPDHRSGRRQGRAHALGPAQGAAPHRRPLDAGACAGDRPGGRRRRGWRWWWRRAWRRCAPRLRPSAPGIDVFEQTKQAGTADAVLAARPAIEAHRGDVTVLFADTPLIEVATLRKLTAALEAGAGIAALGFEPADATGYGRLIVDGEGRVTAIREHNDASEAERRIRLCNAGAMAFRVADLAGLLARIGNANAKGEYYLTDAIALAAADGLATRPVVCSEDEAMGVNSREQLAAAEAVFQRRARSRAMQAGATLTAPDTVWFSFDTQHRPRRDHRAQRVLRPGRGDRGQRRDPGQLPHGRRAHPQGRAHRTVRALPSGSRHRRRRSRRQLRRRSRTPGWKRAPRPIIWPTSATRGSAAAPTSVPARSSATTTASTSTSPTSARACSSGPTSSLVAPVKIGDGAYIGSGSVISKNVEPDALALERAEQEQRPGWAAKFRTMMGRRKKQP